MGRAQQTQGCAPIMAILGAVNSQDTFILVVVYLLTRKAWGSTMQAMGRSIDTFPTTTTCQAPESGPLTYQCDTLKTAKGYRVSKFLLATHLQS